MLVMTRKPGDTIAIGDRIVVKVLDVQGGKVQLGIDAPKDVRIGDAPPAPASQPAKK